MADSKLQAVLEYFLKWEALTPNAIFLRQPIGNTWKEFSWKVVGIEARKIAVALRGLGIQKGDRVAILSQNCAGWVQCDIGIMMAGCISVPLYANVNASTLSDILTHSGSKMLFIGKLVEKDWDHVRSSIPNEVTTVTMNGYPRNSITPWENFIQGQGDYTPIIPVSGDIFTIIYTSGTTGTPKGVVHTNSSMLNAVEVASSDVNLDKKGNRFFSYLPLSHAAERGLVEFGALYSGGSISFVESQESFASTIREAMPTHFFGVPRIWEKFQSKILEAIPQKKLDLLLKLPVVASLVKLKIKKSLGLQRAEIILTGAAPIAPDLIVWFKKIGIRIREAYGMSENFNVCTMNPKNDIRIGSVGRLFPNQEVLIDPETNEIIQRCDWIMHGYYKDPELTALTIKNGFLHTGDMGELSADGFLRLTGRVKDIFKTSKGEYIAPGKIEMKFMAVSAVDQACAMGTTYPQPFVIIVLSEAGKGMDKIPLTDLLKSTLDEYNQDCMEYQKMKKIIIVKDEWTNDNGLLTPTLKMKRNALTVRYEKALESHYNFDAAVSWE